MDGNMKTFKITSSDYIGYLDYSSSLKISLPEDSTNKDNFSNIMKNFVLLFDQYVYEEIADESLKNVKNLNTIKKE